MNQTEPKFTLEQKLVQDVATYISKLPAGGVFNLFSRLVSLTADDVSKEAQEQTFTIDKVVMQEILDCLATRPVGEVFELCNRILLVKPNPMEEQKPSEETKASA